MDLGLDGGKGLLYKQAQQRRISYGLFVGKGRSMVNVPGSLRRCAQGILFLKK